MNAIYYYSTWFISVLLTIVVIVIVPLSFQYWYLHHKYVMYIGKQYLAEEDIGVKKDIRKKLRRSIFSVSPNPSIADDETTIELKNKIQSKVKQLNRLVIIAIILILLLLLLVFLG